MPNSLRKKYLLHGGLLWVLILLLGAYTEAQATHIRAGDITAKRDTTPNPNPLRFFFTMRIYTDRASIADDPTVTIANGDGTTSTVPKERNAVVGDPADLVDVEIYRWEYTYPAPGTYIISWTGINRNPNILNVTPPSDQLTFFISTTININPLRGFNSTPVLTVPPVDLAAVGRVFVHNPGAYDADGDSLAFKLRVPQQRGGTAALPSNVPGYVLPSLYGGGCTTSTGSGNSFLTLDVTNGQLIWDAPCIKGEYNVAFVVEEWRVSANGAVKLGEVVRDMQIIVKETPNRPPQLAPKDTCVIAGTTLNGIIRATDPDGDLIDLTAIGGILPPATFRQTSRTQGAATGQFSWATSCSDVRERPYQVIFKAEDVRPPNETELVDLQPWNIRVVGPPPQNLLATSSERTVTVTWDPYICQNASTIRIYRREGASGFVPDVCETGVPASTGYVLIAEVDASETSYTDNNNGAGLKAGAEYCYIIYAEFPGPARGKSIASNESCVVIEQDIPYLTNVTVDATDATNGRITVKWIKPRNIERLTQPLEYRLYRKVGQQTGAGFTEVKRTRNMDDVTFEDQGLNTVDNAYRYRLEFYQAPQAGGQPTALRDSTEASSVFLTVTPGTGDQKEIKLDWTYSVPWKNEVRRHLIYRQINGTFTLIDSVTATASSGTYTDRGTFGGAALERGTSYCYYVQTVGSYEIKDIPSPLRNNSQQVCAVLPKVVCAPILSIQQLDCAVFNQSPTQPPYQNVLTWEPQITGDCTDEIDFYTVYFKPTDDAEFVQLATTKETTYTHTGLQSFAGCYVVTATALNGQVSPFSNEACNDNCINFTLPNIITPNGDGLNDIFRPDKKSLFIRSMKFKVFNRWGVLVYDKTATGGGDDVYINWPGVDNNGNRLTDGVYYYEAEVEFFTRNPAESRKKYKGWVEIVR
ncbi:gliding motility-associated C-terminal domain-containing protein [uncultured Pontibacter sp.]|uniref:T9SS type B sorting domain-containing protein n=1 Tax=uncultured Pontibacter sp. TaxID=453356 RepID=UPI002618E32B|nr:gliding motility-associated C-terminal domain-containing protein [uncultured Pontibacter sp.]